MEGKVSFDLAASSVGLGVGDSNPITLQDVRASVCILIAAGCKACFLLLPVWRVRLEIGGEGWEQMVLARLG